jgi:hypothetical protein
LRKERSSEKAERLATGEGGHGIYLTGIPRERRGLTQPNTKPDAIRPAPAS